MADGSLVGGETGDLADAVVSGVGDEEISHCVDGQSRGGVERYAAGDAGAGVGDLSGGCTREDARAGTRSLLEDLVCADGGKRLSVLDRDVEVIGRVEGETVGVGCCGYRWRRAAGAGDGGERGDASGSA